jgi:hypothetical protein
MAFFQEYPRARPLTQIQGSGVQIIPNIIDEVSKLYTWFRNKTFVLPPPNQDFSAAGGANFKCAQALNFVLLYIYTNIPSANN